MLAMQYSMRLPQNFDIQSVYDRVSSRRPLFVDLPGLAHKFYLYDHVDHVYAPLYIWRDHQAAHQFLMEDLFSGFVDTFGRPRVRTWNVLEFDYGKAGISPRYACSSLDKVDPGQNLQKIAQMESQRHQRMLCADNLFANLILLDTDRWELARFSFWADQADAISDNSDCRCDFEVIDPVAIENAQH